MPAETAALLAAELWYTSDSEGPGAVLAGLREALAADFPGAAFTDGAVLLTHPDYRLELGGRNINLSTGIMVPADAQSGAAALEATPTDQSWTWPEAEDVVAGCRRRILVTEVLATAFTPVQRVAAFHRVLRTLSGATAPAAIRWVHTAHWRSPAELQEAHPLAGPVNIRFFTVADDDGAMVIDSVGLAGFSVPDIQLHFRGTDPLALMELGFNVAAYLYENGPVIADGGTLTGPGGMRLTARWEDSLLPPLRPVIDLEPEPPYAAGARRAAPAD